MLKILAAYFNFIVVLLVLNNRKYSTLFHSMFVVVNKSTCANFYFVYRVNVVGATVNNRMTADARSSTFVYVVPFFRSVFS